jgi:putative cardiolipin synthase
MSLSIRSIRLRAGLVLSLALAGCALPKHVVRTPSSALVATEHTRLGRMVAHAMTAHPGESGFLLFNTGEGAIQARVALSDVAESSIDAQYFLWAGDAIGRVLLAHVVAAADRGVRVRLLIDDYNSRGYDLGFAALAAHPNIEVRVFNPFARGWMRLLQFIGRFTELNHRMHNKLFVVDGRAAIVGGRNVSDDYFGLGAKINFRDFDLLAIGPIVTQTESGFDRYWNSRWAYPIGSLVKPAARADLEKARARFARHVTQDVARFPYALPCTPDEAMAWLERARGQIVWGPAEVVYDDPSVMAKKQKTPGAVFAELAALARATQREIIVENAYLLPQKDAPALQKLRARGVELTMLTNSLASTDEVAVNAHYASSRPRLAQLGVGLYEMKPYAASRELYIARSTTSRAHLSLHAKAAVIDRAVVFVGSFNLDPRSMALDTETVFVVHSAELAQQLLDAFAIDFEADNAWHIGNVRGRRAVAWITHGSRRTEVEPHDPANAWRRFVRAVAAILPIRSLL